MNAIKRILCMVLALVMCLGILASCDGSNKPNDPKDTDTADQNEENSKDDDQTVNGDDDTDDNTVTTDYKTSSELEQNYDFGNKEFVILTRGSTAYEFESETALEGNPVEQAIFERNEEVMERCNVSIVLNEQPGDWGNLDSFTTLLRNNKTAPKSEFDLVGTHSAYLVSATIEGVAYDFNSLPNIHLDKRWWSESYYNEVQYNDTIYMMYGDIAYTLYEYLQVIFFNEQMAEDLGIEDLYDLAIDGDWTFAKLKEYTTKVTTDESLGDQTQYGFMTNAHSERAITTAFAIDFCPMGADGKRTIPMFMPNEMYEPLADFIDFVLNNDSAFSIDNAATAADQLNPIFSAGRALFYTQTLGEASYLKSEMADNYGVLPFPKYDDNQIEYRTGIRDTVTGIIVPSNCQDAEMAGTVTEMLSMLSYEKVIDAYYEEALKYQSFNNPDCVETLEIIRNAFNPSFAQIYSYYLTYINSIVSGNIESGAKTSIATTWAASSKARQNLLNELYIKLDELGAN